MSSWVVHFLKSIFEKRKSTDDLLNSNFIKRFSTGQLLNSKVNCNNIPKGVCHTYVYTDGEIPDKIYTCRNPFLSSNKNCRFKNNYNKCRSLNGSDVKCHRGKNTKKKYFWEITII